MNIHERLLKQKGSPDFFTELLNSSFPVLSFISYKFGLKDELNMWPLRMVYDEAYAQDRSAYGEVLQTRIGEREISLYGHLTLAGLLKYSYTYNIHLRQKERAIKEVVKIFEKMGYDDRLPMFMHGEIGLTLESVFYFKRDCQSFVQYLNSSMNYCQYLLQSETLRLKGVSNLPAINGLYHLHFASSAIK